MQRKTSATRESRVAAEQRRGFLPELLAEFANGSIILLVDSAGEDCHASMALASQAATEASLGFLQRFGSGIVCVSLTEDRLDALDLPLMAQEHPEEGRPAFALSVDVLDGTTTGISAGDRAKTIGALIHPSTRPTDLARPGHVYPIRYQRTRQRHSRHHADLALNLAVQAGLYPSGVTTTLLNDDGSLAGCEQSLAFAQRHRLLVASIFDIPELEAEPANTWSPQSLPVT